MGMLTLSAAYSCLHVQHCHLVIRQETPYCFLHVSSFSTQCFQHLRQWTDHHPILAKVRNFVLQGWPTHLAGDEFQLFLCRKQELSVCNNVRLRGSRVTVPPKVRERESF